MILTAVGYFQYELPDNYSVSQGNTLSINSPIPINVNYNVNTVVKNILPQDNSKKTNGMLRLFGIIPIKKASINFVENNKVSVLGTPFGIKLYTDGVLVVRISSVDTSQGDFIPASEAGIKQGDIIKSIDGVKVKSNSDISYIIENSNGKELDFSVVRNNKTLVVKLAPKFSVSSNQYKCGIWVRDSTAGIGTLTFYNPKNNVICGLGHALCDVDTDLIMPVGQGELVSADIIAFTKSKKGAPGELKGKLTSKTIGQLKYNCNYGIFGETTANLEHEKVMEIASFQEVKVGNAQILTTLDSNGPKLYNCKILSFNYKDSTNKNMVIKITDDVLIEKTGGIMQGMSGSPILQNGKLIGAITHVLVDDPTKGYGVFAENMLETAQSVSQQQLKEAS